MHSGMAPLVPTLSPPPKAPTAPTARTAARELATVLRAVERHPEFLATLSHSPSQFFAWSQEIINAFLWTVIPAVSAWVFCVRGNHGPDVQKWAIAGVFVAGGWSVVRVWRFSAAPVERFSAIVLDAIATEHRGRRKRYGGGRSSRYTYKVILETGAGTRTFATDESTFRKAQNLTAGIAWRRGRYLLDWQTVEA